MRKLLVLLLLAPCALVAQVPDYVPTDGLIAWYPLENDLLDASGNGHHGTSDNTTFGNGLLLSAESNPVLLPSSLEINGTQGGISLGGWMKLDSANSNWKLALDLTDGNANNAWNDRVHVSYLNENGTPGWSTGGHFDNDISTDYTLFAPDSGLEGNWRHVIASFDFEGTIRLYVDGILSAESEDVSAIGDCYLIGGNEGSRKIGARAHNTNPDLRWIGSLRDMGVWNRVLTEEEITTLFTAEESPSLPNYVPTDGLVAYYPLDGDGEDAGPLDLNGTVHGTTPLNNRFGAANHALNFDGDGDWINLGNLEDWNFVDYSINLWYSTTETPDLADYRALICRGDAYGLHVGDTGGGGGANSMAYVNANGGSGAFNYVDLSDGDWHMMTAVRSSAGGYLKLYVDGVLADSVEANPGSLSSPQPLSIGRYWDINPHWFNGGIDDVGIWNRGLTEEEIAGLASNPGLDSDTIELLIVGAHGEETATREALEAYQLDATLTDRDLSITEVDFQDSISPCGQWDALLAYKDAVLFLGTANLDNCSWEDIIPSLDSFMRAGGEVYLQAENSYSMVTRFDGNGSSWPEYWHDHMTEAEAANWFGTAFTAQQLWCCGMASTNAHCSDNADVLGISHDCNPLFAGIYDYPFDNACTGWLGEPWLFEVPSEEINDGIGFSVFQFGGDPTTPENPNNALSGAEAVFGRSFDSGHLIILGDNHPGFGYEGSRNLLGNLIHGLSHPEGLSDLIAPTSDCTEPPAILGCTDAAACNYDPAATEDDGSCDYSCCPGPGCCAEGTVWDIELEQCVGEFSPCDTVFLTIPSCGTGTVWDPVAEECIVAIPTDTDFDGCVSAGDLLNLLGTFGTCPPIPEWPDESDSPWVCGDSLAYQGYDYVTVQIGGQCWFAENLRATESADGELLEAGTPSTWPGFQNGTGAWAYPNNHPLEEVVFGLLYNWFATVQGDGICPSGWHLPSDEEWKDMETHLGIPAAELDSFGWHGANQGTELKAVAEWDGVDMHGFAALPSGGMHADQGHATSFGSEVWFWTSTTLPADSGKAMFRSLSSGESRIQRHHTFKNHGASVRCLKD